MGRLSKAKIDQIQALLKDNYLKKEVAKKVGVHVRTVSKYDLDRKSAPGKASSTTSRLENVEQLIITALDWLSVMEGPVLASKDNVMCPRCENFSLWYTEGDDVAYICKQCGYRVTWPREVCRYCLSQRKIDYDEQSDKRICSGCGKIQNC